MNSNYRRGVRAEYRIKKLLESTGYTVIRAAGSHGHFDLVAWDKLGFRLIQSKTGSARVTPQDRESMKTMPRPANSSLEIWTFKPRMREPLIERLA